MFALNVSRNAPKKDTRSYRNFKYMPTKKLKEILNDPYCRGIDGHDYGPYENELRDILFERQTKEFEKNIDRRMEEYYEHCYK